MFKLNRFKIVSFVDLIGVFCVEDKKTAENSAAQNIVIKIYSINPLLFNKGFRSGSLPVKSLKA